FGYLAAAAAVQEPVADLAVSATV
ncbi:MAG: hypothetical protein JWM73_2392, partial [Solirubrobacterales bacterium]|nr:hypothetical protein [Solirubrobacterales bacterium]